MVLLISLDNHGNGDGKVDMSELEKWVGNKVSEDASSKFKVNQNPKFIYNPHNKHETLSIVDSSFKNEWAMKNMKRMSGEDVALNYKNSFRQKCSGSRQHGYKIV